MKKSWVIYISILLFYIFSHIFFYIFFASYNVDGFSMRPNFENKENCFVYSNHYEDNTINYGDVVILKFKNEEGEFLKRVVGLPKDKIKITNGILNVNGKEKTSKTEIEMNIFVENLTPKKSYKILNMEKSDNDFDFKSITIPKNHYFVLGDNRQNSGDSREYGTVNKDQILHKIVPKTHFIYNFSFYF